MIPGVGGCGVCGGGDTIKFFVNGCGAGWGGGRTAVIYLLFSPLEVVLWSLPCVSGRWVVGFIKNQQPQKIIIPEPHPIFISPVFFFFGFIRLVSSLLLLTNLRHQPLPPPHHINTHRQSNPILKTPPFHLPPFHPVVSPISSHSLTVSRLIYPSHPLPPHHALSPIPIPHPLPTNEKLRSPVPLSSLINLFYIYI